MLKYKSLNEKKGFTLLEVIVALSIMAMVGLSISSLYLAIIKYDNKKIEVNWLKNTVNNIHSLYISSPDEWQVKYYGLYNKTFDEQKLGDELIIGFDRNFVIIPEHDNDDAYYKVIYSYSKENNIYHLEITSVIRKDKQISEKIDFGRWKLW